MSKATQAAMGVQELLQGEVTALLGIYWLLDQATQLICQEA